MSKKFRKAMIEAIIQYARVKGIYIDLILMENISYQICRAFPTEIMVLTTWLVFQLER